MSHIALMLLLFTALPAAAQETRSLPPGTSSPPAKIEQLAWIAGTWRGDGLGGPATETFSSPQAGQIAAHFVQEDNKGGIAFFEFEQIVPQGASLLYRVRHFNADLTGWEDAKGGKAEDFPLVAIERDAAYFDGLTLKREGKDRLTVWVRIAQDDGTTKEIPFRFRRAAP